MGQAALSARCLGDGEPRAGGQELVVVEIDADDAGREGHVVLGAGVVPDERV